MDGRQAPTQLLRLVDFVPTARTAATEPTASPAIVPHLQQIPEDPALQPVAHLQGWTGPALFPLSNPRGSKVDVFLPGLWVTLHIICINTFVLHTLQKQGSGRQVRLMDFTRTLASQLAVGSSVAASLLPRPNSTSYQETGLTKFSSLQRFVLTFISAFNLWEKQSSQQSMFGIKPNRLFGAPNLCNICCIVWAPSLLCDLATRISTMNQSLRVVDGGVSKKHHVCLIQVWPTAWSRSS